MKIEACLIALVVAATAATSSYAAHWSTAPSYYTHEPLTGQRVSQYTPIGPVYVFPRGDYLQSGYRHTRSSIQVGQSSDNLHIVEEWGRPVRPYEEWRFPYRPYSVPYDLWGPPAPVAPYGSGYPGSPLPYGPAYGVPSYGGSGYGGPGYGGPGSGGSGYGPTHPGHGHPGGYPRFGAPPSAAPPYRSWEDGHHRPYPSNPNFRVPDRDYFSRP